jgi:integrase
MMIRNRANGEGTVYARKNRQGKIIGYRGSYWIQTPQGPKRRYVYGKTKTEAIKQLRKAATDRDGGLAFDPQNLKLGEYLNKWLNGSVRGTVRQRTWERYEQIARVHIKPTLGSVKLQALTSIHVRELYSEKLDSGLAPRTVQYVHTTLHKALKDAVADGLIPRNVTEGIKAPRPEKHEMNVLSPDQARSFLEAACGDRFEALYVVAVHCGLREGELLGLRWDDVDLEAGTLSVRRTLSESKEKGYIFEPPKNGKGRSVRLSQTASEALTSHLKRQLRYLEEAGDQYKDQGLIFPSERGTPMNAKNLTARSFKPILKRASLPDIRLHDLRHTCATLLLARGVHPKFVQELLGHATISITLDTYSHVLPSMGDQTATEMENALS